MNTELRSQHMEQITNPVAIRCYDRLCDACASRPEGISDQDQMLIADYANMEQLKQHLYEDIRARGVVEDFHNGRQRMKRENKSVATARMLMDQQRKHLAELKLTPNSRKAASVPVNDEFDEF
ncbi:MAG: P27 family phage terminase small subunit [Clostridia bacterium]|nr:P27 family phage terminase small subunit [Clostridia bacterium]